MIPRIRYLDWAIRTFPSVAWNLASSGVAPVTVEELGQAPDQADPRSFGRFIAAVAARYGVSEGEVTPALGTSGALWVVAAALVGRGDDVLVEDPAYEPLYRGAEGLGAQVRRFRRDPSEGFCIDVGRIVDALTPNTKAVFLSNPHNPSGIMAPDEEVGALAAALAPRGVLLLVDEVYRELFVPGTTARRLGPNVVAVSSLTKCFGVGWARAGWVLAPPDLADGLRAATMHVTGELPRMTCAVGAHAFGRIEELLARARAFGEGNRDRVDVFAAKHAADLAWTPPGRGAVFGVFEDRRGRDMGPIIEAGYQREGVLVVPGAFFGLPSAFRLSWTIGRAQIKEALARLERALGLVGA